MRNTFRSNLRALIVTRRLLPGGGFRATSLAGYHTALKSIGNGIGCSTLPLICRTRQIARP